MQTEQKTNVINWLKSIGATTWVRYDVTDDKEIEDAADWFIEQINKFNQYLLDQQVDPNYQYWAEEDEDGVFVTDGNVKAYMCGLDGCDLRFINKDRTICGGACAEHDMAPHFVTLDGECDGTLADQIVPEDWTPEAFGD